MARHGIVSLVGAALVFGAALARAADDDSIKPDLKQAKFKAAEGVPAELFGYNEGEGKLFFYTNGKAELTVKLPGDGEYEIVVKASGDPAQNERAKFKLELAGEAVGKETTLTADDPKDYKFTAKGKAGEQKLTIEFTNDVYKEGEYDRNLYVHAVKLEKKK